MKATQAAIALGGLLLLALIPAPVAHAAAPLAAGTPTAYTWGVDQTQHVDYRGLDDHVHELWFNLSTGWHHSDLTLVTGAPPAAGSPSAYTWAVDQSQHVDFIGATDDDVHELWFNLASGWHHRNLSVAAAAPGAEGDTAGYTWDVDQTQHVIYRGRDSHIHELWFNLASGWHSRDLTLAAGAPPANSDTAGYTWDMDRTEHVDYRGIDNHIYELWSDPSTVWHHSDLTSATNAPLAAGSPSGYTWSVDQSQHVDYLGLDNHIHELWFNLSSGWHSRDLTLAAGAPPAAGNPSSYTWAADQTQHVDYRGTDSHIHELWFNLSSGWHHSDLTAVTGAPPANSDTTGYTWNVDQTQHVDFRAIDDHIYELWFSLAGGWHSRDLSQAAS